MQLTETRWLVTVNNSYLRAKKETTVLKIFVIYVNALKEQICIFDITVHDLIPS